MPTDDFDRVRRYNPDCDTSGPTGRGQPPRHRKPLGRPGTGCSTAGSAGAQSSEFKGTPFFNSKLPHDKVLAVVDRVRQRVGDAELGDILREFVGRWPGRDLHGHESYGFEDKSSPSHRAPENAPGLGGMSPTQPGGFRTRIGGIAARTLEIAG